MTRPIPDKAEIALEYPDKLYIGTFQNTARFDAHLDQTGVSLTLDRTGDADTRKSVRMHFHYALPAQLVDATHALNLSAGVSNPRVLRGRSLSWRATLLR
jgi:hypothetical protein